MHSERLLAQIVFSISDTKSGFLVQISDFGAAIVRIMTPDRNGHVDDITFNQDSPENYVKYGGYLGAVVGRVANRIENGEFILDGVKYSLFKNDQNLHCLHGGREGFNLKKWECIETTANDSEAILIFQYVSSDGEEGFPGDLKTKLTYKITPDSLEWIFESTTNRPTIVNLTNHSYWNLDGLDTTIDGLEISVDADFYMPGDENNLPTGEILPVEGTDYDCRRAKSFKVLFNTVGDIDNNYILNGYQNSEDVEEGEENEYSSEVEPFFAAEVYSPSTGRKMSIFTNQPGLQVYTGNNMEGLESNGMPCKKHSAICLEAQKHPNAINLTQFAHSVILRPGKKYMHRTIHKFSTSKFIRE